MSNLVGNREDRFSCGAGHVVVRMESKDSWPRI